jgi:hypothetical protein
LSGEGRGAFPDVFKGTTPFAIPAVEGKDALAGLESDHVEEVVSLRTGKLKRRALGERILDIQPLKLG